MGGGAAARAAVTFDETAEVLAQLAPAGRG